MNYWWVNHKQTYRQELAGGYLWSPKLMKNQARSAFYENMRRVLPGDIVFSFANAQIQAIGIVQSTAYGFPKPEEFGNTGANWSMIGWRVDVQFIDLERKIRPKDYIDRIRNLLPEKYSPLQQSGNGNQVAYLSYVPDPMAVAVVGLIGREAQRIVDTMSSVAASDRIEIPVANYDGVVQMEERLVEQYKGSLALSETERTAVVLSRRGQGDFRRNVSQLETSCRVTEVSRSEHLIASHIKPWRYCEDAQERLSGTNGLFLTPSVDHLFDHGFISFEDSGELIVSPVADALSLEKMGVEPVRVRPRNFNSDQKHFLSYHRDEVLLLPRVK